jgi:hypothetical protein
MDANKQRYKGTLIPFTPFSAVGKKSMVLGTGNLRYEKSKRC